MRGLRVRRWRAVHPRRSTLRRRLSANSSKRGSTRRPKTVSRSGSGMRLRRPNSRANRGSQTQDRMRQEAERNPATLVLSLGVVCRFLFFLCIIGVGIAPQQARCDRDRNERRAAERDCGNDAVHSAYRTCKSRTGTRRIASPITPPSPDGSGQCALRGRQAAKAAASTAPSGHNRTRSRSRPRKRCPSSR